MDPDPNSEEQKPEEEKQPLPVSEPTSTEPVKAPIEAGAPPIPKQEVSAALGQQYRDPEVKKEQKPLQVEVIEDDELNTFEKKTVKFALAGIVISSLALIAASAGAYFVFQQFKEMAAQTDLLNRSARQARADSAANSIATTRQLQALQDQLIEQRQGLAIDQRPWLKFELGGERPKDIDPNNMKSKILSTAAGQPIKIATRVTNIGKTTAERIRGTLIVQYVHQGKKPIVVPRRGKNILFSESRKPQKGTLPGIAWIESTLYPNEVSENSFSRSRWGKNGEVEDDPITESEKVDLDTGKAYLLIIGQVWYSDVFGVSHWTKFCVMSKPDLDMTIGKGCIAFGEVDTNKPKGNNQPGKPN